MTPVEMIGVLVGFFRSFDGINLKLWLEFPGLNRVVGSRLHQHEASTTAPCSWRYLMKTLKKPIV